jgi:hypothetical protein
MERIFTILAFIIIIGCASCEQAKTHHQKNLDEPIQADTSLLAILPFDTTQHWFFKDGQPTDLSSKELSQIEHILQKCISNYNPEQEKRIEEINKEHPEYKLNKNAFIIDLSKYKRQYVPVLNAKGEKEVWINCFCNTWNSDWKKNLIFVHDGGNCYFNVKVNLTTGKYYELIVNGEA